MHRRTSSTLRVWPQRRYGRAGRSSGWHDGSMRLAVRVAAGLFALMALVWPGWGGVDLSVSWSADWNPILSGGWGLFFTVLVAVPFGIVAVRPQWGAPAIWVLGVASASMAVAVVIGLEGPLAWLLAWLLLGTACVALPPVVEPWRPIDPVWRPRTLVIVAVTSSAWLAYAWSMGAHNRQGRTDTDFSSGVDHYSVQSALGLALPLMAVMAAGSPRGRRLMGALSGVCAVYLGALWIGWAGYPGGMARPWAVAAILWGVALVGWSWLGPRPRPLAPLTTAQPLPPAR